MPGASPSFRALYRESVARVYRAGRWITRSSAQPTGNANRQPRGSGSLTSGLAAEWLGIRFNELNPQVWSHPIKPITNSITTQKGAGGAACTFAQTMRGWPALLLLLLVSSPAHVAADDARTGRTLGGRTWRTAAQCGKSSSRRLSDPIARTIVSAASEPRRRGLQSLLAGYARACMLARASVGPFSPTWRRSA